MRYIVTFKTGLSPEVVEDTVPNIKEYGESWDKGIFSGKAWIEANSTEQALAAALNLQTDYEQQGYRTRCKLLFGIK